MNMHEKMATCKHHRYLDDFHDKCLHSGIEYSCDAPEDTPLWEVCKNCKDYLKYEPHLGVLGESKIYRDLVEILEKHKNKTNIYGNRYRMIQDIQKYLYNWSSK